MNSVYKTYLDENRFDEKLKKWECKYQNKKVILYGCGLLFDEIVKDYNIAEKLNIIGVCDVKYEKNKPDNYLGFKTIKPSELKSVDFDVLIFTVFDHLVCLNYLNTFDFFDESKIFRYINEPSIKSKLKSIYFKSITACKYLAITKNPIKTIKYFLSCNNVEYNSKYNYIKVLKRIRSKKERLCHNKWLIFDEK